MEFGKYIGKGLWAFADKALPAIYGVGFVVFVVRILPPSEYGVYVLVQAVFLIVSGVGQTFALQPIAKFASERKDAGDVVLAGGFLYATFLVIVSIPLVVFSHELWTQLNAPDVEGLTVYILLLLAASFVRGVAIFLLQARLEIAHVFWIDFVYFVGSLLGVALPRWVGALDTAERVLIVNVVMFALSSVLATIFMIGRIRSSLVFRTDTLRQFWNYSRFSLGIAVNSSLFSQADNFVISAILGPVYVAIYSAAKVFIRAYDMLIQVIYMLLIPAVSRLSAQEKRGDLRVLVEKSTFYFTAFSVPAVLILSFFSPTIVDLFYGDKYPLASSILRILAITGIFLPGIAVMASVALGSSYVKQTFYITLITTCLTIMSLIGFVLWFGVVGSGWAILTSTAVAFSIWYGFTVTRMHIPLQPLGIFNRYRDAMNYLSKLVDRGRQSLP
jgi:O-antigen/teichoic acid export membrane protein